MRNAVYLALAIAVGCSNPSTEPPSPATTAPVKKPLPPLPPRELEPAPMPKVDLALGTGFEMRRPIQDGRLTLIPIVATTELAAKKYITLQEGMASGQVLVREVSVDWQVDTVRITNKSDSPLLVMSGELLIDAMQDRVTAENTVIMAKASKHVDVRCVEEERDYGNTVFHPGNALAEVALRRTVAFSDQDNVWEHVNRINRRHGLNPHTKTYRQAAAQLLKAANNTARRDSLLGQLDNREERGQMVGFAVAVDNQIIAIERFATPELYRTLEPRLVASYLPESDGKRAEGKKLSPEEVRTFVRTGHTSATAANVSILKRL